MPYASAQGLNTDTTPTPLGRLFLASATGSLVGILGGLIGLGGAEFRLPILIGLFCFGALEAVILNKTMSLVVVAASLPFRFGSVPFSSIAEHWSIVATLLCGSLIGAWIGASLAIKIHPKTLYKVLAVLLVAVALVLPLGHNAQANGNALLNRPALPIVGVVAGFGIGIFAALMGVAGGELLIPTIVLLFGTDLKLAGSLSLAVSLPTMLVAFARYSQDRTFIIIKEQRGFIASMAVGSLLGAFIGSRLLGVLPTGILMVGLVAILLISSIKIWRHS